MTDEIEDRHFKIVVSPVLRWHTRGGLGLEPGGFVWTIVLKTDEMKSLKDRTAPTREEALAAANEAFPIFLREQVTRAPA